MFDEEESMHCSTSACEGCSVSQRRCIPSTPPAPPLEVAEGKRDCLIGEDEVCWDPESDEEGIDDNDVSRWESDGSAGPVPVVVEEKVEVEAEGDVKGAVPEVIESKDHEDDEDDSDVDVEFEKKMADKRTMQRVYQSLGDEDDDDDGLEEYMRSSRMKSAKFSVGQVKGYESKIDELRQELAFVRDGFRAAKRMADSYRGELQGVVDVNQTLQDQNWHLEERSQKLVEDNARREMRYEAEK